MPLELTKAKDEPKDVVLKRQSVQGKTILVHIVRVPFIFEDDSNKTKNLLSRSIKRIFAYYEALNRTDSSDN